MLNPALKPSRSARIGLSFRLVPPVLAAAAAFALYLATMPPSITWQSGGQDSGNLAVAVQGLGIPHPTGYPTYVLLGKLFSYLPFGDLAYRLNVMSAVFAAGTVFFTYLLIVGLGRIKGGYMPVESPNPPSPPLVTYRPPLAPLIRG
ncbi:MAG: DUF2723 domain-containing protein, partial [Chloroflexi bacterium]|nr:DUF2723 domain-containing protein [Chloroflexota bacterium]